MFRPGGGTNSNSSSCCSVAIPSVRVSVFRPEVLWRGEEGERIIRVAIPSVRVSVFRLVGPTLSVGLNFTGSQYPQFGSRCFDVAPHRRHLQASQLPSQSPQFGSRCFDLGIREGLGKSSSDGSQSPQFGSRCFDPELSASPARTAYPVAIPSVRVSVFRLPDLNQYRPIQESIDRRNPLSSGLGVSTRRVYARAPSRSGTQVAIPSVRVSVFRPDEAGQRR